MSDRDDARHHFVQTSDWKGAEIVPLAADASFRRYFRLWKNDRSAVLMDAPPSHEDCKPFVAIANHLGRLGFSVPSILDANIPEGFLIIKDLGDLHLKTVVQNNPAREMPFYKDAADVIACLSAQNVPKRLSVEGNDESFILGHYDEALYIKEANIFYEWAAPQYGQQAQENWPILERLFRDLIGQIGAPSTLTLRDYHAENLLIIEHETGMRRIGLLDFQDAVKGHPAYDIASLIYDARRCVPNEVANETIDQFLTQQKNLGIDTNPMDFRFAVNVLAAQRNIKIIGIFNRLADRDNKHHYRDLIPHVWRLLETNLSQPELSEVKYWFDNNVPLNSR